MQVVQAGAIPVLVQLLKSKNDDVKGHAAWVFSGSVASKHRDASLAVTD